MAEIIVLLTTALLRPLVIALVIFPVVRLAIRHEHRNHPAR